MAEKNVIVKRLFKDPLLQERYETLLNKNIEKKLTPEQEKRLQKIAELSQRFFGDILKKRENLANTKA